MPLEHPQIEATTGARDTAKPARGLQVSHSSLVPSRTRAKPTITTAA